MKTFQHLTLTALAAVLPTMAMAQWPGMRMRQPDPIPDLPKYVFHESANPYLPLWEHLPDGEPRVFEDPDNPGKYRVYIIGSHDVRYDSYCGPDIRMWSAPVEDLNSWRDEGSIFKYNIDNQWDVMYAPDLVCVKGKDGKKTYYLYPHSRGPRREAMVCKGERPDGPFTPINLTADGRAVLEGSCMGFDPSVFVEEITDPADPDYEIGFRAYGYWGFQGSNAAQLDQKTMYSVRPGTDRIERFMPAGLPNGGVREPEGTVYPALYPGEKPTSYNFFEASSIRKIGNKFVTIYSGYSGPEYGIGNSNSTLRYAYADTPLGPWKSGGVLVDSRAPVLNEDGTAMTTSNAAHNTHGSIEQINGQWYVFYHRPPRGFGYARQAVVAPIHVVSDAKPVSKGGKVAITAFDPYLKKNSFTVKASNGNEYKGAEVTSEGFNVYGLDPYKYYSAGIACYLSDVGMQQDAWDVWNNHSAVDNIKNGCIVGYKYFGFGGLATEKLGLKPFEGTKEGNNTKLNLFITPRTQKSFKVKVMLDGPWDNKVWRGKELGTITIDPTQPPSNSPSGGELASKTSPEGRNGGVAPQRYVLDAAAVDKLSGKHAIYLVAEGDGNEPLFCLEGLGFTANNDEMKMPEVPTVDIKVNGKSLCLPKYPARSTNLNGYCDNTHYCLTYNTEEPMPLRQYRIEASASSPEVKCYVGRIDQNTRKAEVTFHYNGQPKVYEIQF